MNAIGKPRQAADGTSQASGSQPLSGLKVAGFTQVMTGPCATQMPGDYGADVIKIDLLAKQALRQFHPVQSEMLVGG